MPAPPLTTPASSRFLFSRRAPPRTPSEAPPSTQQRFTITPKFAPSSAPRPSQASSPAAFYSSAPPGGARLKTPFRPRATPSQSQDISIDSSPPHSPSLPRSPATQAQAHAEDLDFDPFPVSSSWEREFESTRAAKRQRTSKSPDIDTSSPPRAQQEEKDWKPKSEDCVAIEEDDSEEHDGEIAIEPPWLELSEEDESSPHPDPVGMDTEANYNDELSSESEHEEAQHKDQFFLDQDDDQEELAKAGLVSVATYVQPAFRPVPRFKPPEISESESNRDITDLFSPQRRGAKYMAGGLAAELRDWLVEIKDGGGDGGESSYLHTRLVVDKVCPGHGMWLVKGHYQGLESGDGGGRGRTPCQAVLAGRGRVQGLEKPSTVREGSVVGIAPPGWHITLGGDTECFWLVACDWYVVGQAGT